VGRIENAANQSLRGAFARTLHSLNVGPWWLTAALLAGAAGLALAAAAARRGDEASAFSICAITALLISPVSWSHHWVLAIPVLLLCSVRAYRRRSALGLAAAAAATALACSGIISSVPIGQHRHAELHLDGAQLLRADAYVIVGLAFLVASAGLPAQRRLRRRLPSAHPEAGAAAVQPAA
jgi:hypothetical protein